MSEPMAWVLSGVGLALGAWGWMASIFLGFSKISCSAERTAGLG